MHLLRSLERHCVPAQLPGRAILLHEIHDPSCAIQMLVVRSARLKLL